MPDRAIFHEKMIASLSFTVIALACFFQIEEKSALSSHSAQAAAWVVMGMSLVFTILYMYGAGYRLWIDSVHKKKLYFKGVPGWLHVMFNVTVFLMATNLPLMLHFSAGPKALVAIKFEYAFVACFLIMSVLVHIHRKQLEVANFGKNQ